MSIANSAYFSFASLLATSGQPVSPAELHGLLLGRSCAGAGFSPDTWLADAADLLGESLPENLRQGLIGLQEMVRSELTGAEMAVVLLLPLDETPLPERAAALGEWCRGFLDGFGMIIGDQALSAEAVEVLQDLASIAQVQEALEESEDGETDYMEVMEYLRVAPLLLFTECGKTAPAQSKPSIH